MELVAEEMSLRLERKLGESENVIGRSRLECVWFIPFRNPGREPALPLPGLCPSPEREEKGLTKVGEAGVSGLRGIGTLAGR